jgi:hypothetical protein
MFHGLFIRIGPLTLLKFSKGYSVYQEGMYKNLERSTLFKLYFKHFICYLYPRKCACMLNNIFKFNEICLQYIL